MRRIFDERHPANSYEICWVLVRKKPHYKCGITREEVDKKITLTRKNQIREWMEENFTHEWFLNHL